MKNLYASFHQGLAEGWSTFWAPLVFLGRLIKKVVVA